MAFTIIDVIFLLVVLILCIRAAAKGFLDEVFGLGTFIVGAYFSVYLMPFLKPYLASCMNETLAAVLSFLILFIAIFLIMKIIQHALKSIFSGAILKSLDHGLGFILGIAEGIFCIILILVVMEVLQPWIDTKSLRESSFLYNAFDKFVNNVSSTFLEHI